MRFSFKITIAVLLATIFLLPFFSAQNFSAASDEITHLPSGYSYWKTGLIQLNPQHPPLVKLMAAFPLLFMDLKFDREDPLLAGSLKDEWQFGSNFLFSNNANRLLFWGRLPIMLLAVLLGWYVFKWASEMFSRKAVPEPSPKASYGAGLLALFFYAFMPVVMANAQLVTTDLPVTAFSFITLYYLWKFFGNNQKKHLIFAGLFLGLALGSKFSAVLLFPIILLLILIRFWPEKLNWEEKINKAMKVFLVLFGLSLAVIWLTYLMPLDFSFYLRGLKSVYADWIKNPKFYLSGEFSSSGWWYYFLFAFLIKTPIPFLTALILSVIFYWRQKMSLQNLSFIFVPILIFGLVTSWKAGQIGIRYLLPVYPFLILFVSGVLDKVIHTRGLSLQSWRRVGLVLLAGWYVFSALKIYPDYLAYFNELVGGSKNGYKYLDDSNIEWGQGLKQLAEYQKQYPETKVLYSWNYVDMNYYGVQNVLPKKPESFLNPSGRYAVNTHFLVRMREISQRFQNENLNWLSLYRPIDKIGYSFLVFEF